MRKKLEAALRRAEKYLRKDPDYPVAYGILQDAIKEAVRPKRSGK